MSNRAPITRDRLAKKDHYRFQVPLNQLHVAAVYGVLDDYFRTRGTDRRVAFARAQELMLEEDFRRAMEDEPGGFASYVDLWLMQYVPEDDLRQEITAFLKGITDR